MNEPITTAPMLAVARLRLDRNDERVFGPLDFSVHAGEALLVTGGNGAGKTTLLRVLAGLLRASAGEVFWEGQPCAGLPGEAIAFVGHHAGHKGELTTLDNLRFALGVRGGGDGENPTQALAEVGLAGYEDIPAGRLSAGQRKRLSLARLLLASTALWLLDEPYANLDRDGMALVDRLLGQHLHAGGAALVTTHGAYAPPPVRTRIVLLDSAGIADPEERAP